jgi:hypothetical protein
MNDTLSYFDNALKKARADNAEKVAVRIIDNKTDDMIVWMTKEEKKNYDRLHARKGQSSKLRNVLVGNGRLM